MIIRKNLVLVGMMGSGKSTIGKIIADKINYKFIDTDQEIEKVEEISIKSIFELKGEGYFRIIEENLIKEIVKNDKLVISLGGGSFLNANTKKLIQKKSISFWLNWNYQTIISRIAFNKKRPLIKNLDRKDLISMMKDRAMVYKDAHFKIDCENLTKIQIVNKILKKYENKNN